MRQYILFVDVYNMIGSWDHLVQLKRLNLMEEARETLISQLTDYSRYQNTKIIIVFDAYFVPGSEQVYDEKKVKVVFTTEGETADMYIEREIKKYRNSLTHISVASSDATEQWIIFQQGAIRLSADELWLNIKNARKDIRRDIQSFHHQSPRRHVWTQEHLRQLNQLRQEIEEKDT